VISLLEVAERARSGPKMGEKKWNLGLFRAMQALVEAYNLTYAGPERFFDVDEGYVDNAFRAAVEFLVERGVYCITSNRVITFTEDEVAAAVREAPTEVPVGAGKEVRVIRKRVIEDPSPVHARLTGHRPWSEALIPLPLVVRELARVSRCAMIEGFNFTTTDGREVYGLPMEAYAARRELAWMRDGVTKAGRPGMSIIYYPISTRASTLLAPIDPEYGLRRTDGILLSTLPDLKVEYDLLTAAMVYEEYGCYRVNGGSFAVSGGFCGGIEGAIIESIAKTIAAWLVYRDCFQYGGCVRKRLESRTYVPSRTVEEELCVWPTYVVNNALSRHTNIIRFGGFFGVPFAGKEGSVESLLGQAVAAMGSTVMGSSVVGGGLIPPVTEFLLEVSDATIAAGIKRADIGDIIQQVLRDTYTPERLQAASAIMQRRIADERMILYTSPHKYFEPIQRIYDFVKQRPSREYVENYQKAKDYLKDLGLTFMG
jgi:methylamine--corrinoid protein Co-methyltransferase